MERQIGLTRALRYRHRSVTAIFLLSSGARAGIFAQVIRRSAAGVFKRPAPDDRLAGPGEIRALHGLPGFRKSEQAGIAGERDGHGRLEGGRSYFFRWRLSRFDQGRTAPQWRQSVHQLVLVAPRPDCLAKI